MKLVLITTVPRSLYFFSAHVARLKARGIEVHALASPGEHLQKFGLTAQVQIHEVEMPRRITPLHDLMSIFLIWRTLCRIRPNIVHAATPKGGLLGMIAAWLARVPVRIYHVFGLPLITARGYRRWLLQWSEKLSCILSHQVLCVSQSVCDLAIALELCSPAKIKVLLKGSTEGIDAVARFNPARHSPGECLKTRARLGIPSDTFVVGYVGRIAREKGVGELAEAWKILCQEFLSMHLLVLGWFDPTDPVPPPVSCELKSDPRIHVTGETTDVIPFYAIMDLLVLPTYREGFGNVLLEAASMGIPTVATRVTGCVDAIEDGVTGTLVAARDPLALADAIRTYVGDPTLRRQHGQAGRDRVLRYFRQDVVCQAIYEEYLRLIRDRGVGTALASPKPEF